MAPFKSIGQELRRTGEAAWSQCHRTFDYVRTRWFASKRLNRNLHELKASLGKELHDRKLGDAKLLARLDEVGEQIVSIEAGKGSTKMLQHERDGLRIRLASSIKPSTLPDNLTELHGRIRQLEYELQINERMIAQRRTSILPATTGDRIRVVAVFGSLVAVLCLIGVLARGPQRINATDDPSISDALGLIVCGVEVTDPDGDVLDIPMASGTGFVVTPDGFLLTNEHVVNDIVDEKKTPKEIDALRARGMKVTPKVWVFFGRDKKHTAEIVHISKDFDLAVLKIDAKGLPVFAVIDEAEVPRLTEVFACGFPGAARRAFSAEEVEEQRRRDEVEKRVEHQFKNRDFDYIVTDGKVSRTIEEQNGRKWLQHNAEINSGNSGGPLLRKDGVVVGINTLKAAEAEGIFISLQMPQLRKELRDYVPKMIWK